MVEEDSCSNCKVYVGTCPTHYMPKQEEDVVEIGGRSRRYSHRRSTMRCTVNCGGCNNVRKDTSKWSTWSPRTMSNMPGASETDEAFDDRCDTDVAAGTTTDIRMRSMIYIRDTTAHSWEDVTRNADGPPGILTCSLCQVVCTPGLDSRNKNDRALVNSDRIEEGDPRLLHPAERIKDWVSPTLDSIIAAMTPATTTDSDQDHRS